MLKRAVAFAMLALAATGVTAQTLDEEAARQARLDAGIALDAL